MQFHLHSSATRAVILASILSMLAPAAAGAGGDDKAVVSRLQSSKHGLREAIATAESKGGAAISAKLEVEEGRLLLSVYGATEALEKCAEKNVLFELKGDATVDKWQPKNEIFEDREHLARASTHLTLMQLTRVTLLGAIDKAEAAKKATAYSAIPVARNGKTAIDVRLATPGGKTVQMFVDETTK